MQLARPAGHWCFGISVLTLLAVGCASNPGGRAITADAARRFSCPESEIRVESLGPNRARAQGCGQSRIYVCRSTRRVERANGPPPLAEYETRGRPVEADRCTWSADE
jgi:hypothetical protein